MIVDARTFKGAIGRADLLRLLAVAPRDQVTLDDGAHGWFGYVRRTEPPAPQLPPISSVPLVSIAAGSETAGAKLPLRMPFAFMIVRREARAAAAFGAEETPADETGGKIDDARLAPLETHRLVGFEDLVPWPRLLPALRRQLGAKRPGQLDLVRLARLIAAGQLPRRLPHRLHERWHPDLVVVLDFSARLWPYREDMHRLAERLVRLVGPNRLSLRVLSRGPFGPWTDWLALQQNAGLPLRRHWTMPPTGTPVLLVTDAGFLLGPDSPVSRSWLQFIDSLQRSRLRPLPLMPLGAGQIDAALTAPVLRWSPDARPHPARARGPGHPEPAGLADLLALSAVIRRIDPPLLRALRRLTPDAPLNAGLEGALWCHPHVEAAFSATLRPEQAEPHRQRFQHQLPALHAAVNARRQRHHAHLNRALAHEELLLWDSRADPAVPRDAASISKAVGFLIDLAAVLRQRAGTSPAVRRIAHGVLDRADEAMRQKHSGVYQRLAAAVIKADPDTPVPFWVDPAALAASLAGEREGGIAWLVQDAKRGELLLQVDPPGARQMPLGDAIRFDAGGVSVQPAHALETCFLWHADMPFPLASLDDPVAEVHLTTTTETVVVAAVRRPRGAEAWGLDDNGLLVCLPTWTCPGRIWPSSKFEGVEDVTARGVLPHFALEAPRKTLETVQAPVPRAIASIACGIDAAFGVYADVYIETTHGTATQRFRWIEAGSFWMGSPEDEPGRDDDEGPRHLVTLTRGFWLAGTPCTQAFWQTVMGTNPSRFQSPDRPVEQVSWEDVQRFLAALEQLLPGCGAGLPTEAEWEYACRAGTSGAIYTGDLDILGARNAPTLDPIAWYAATAASTSTSTTARTALTGQRSNMSTTEPAQVPLPGSSRMPGGCTTCWATSGNGALMAGEPTLTRRKSIPGAIPASVMPPTAPFVAAPGTSAPGGFGPPTAARTPRAMPSPAWAFACP